MNTTFDKLDSLGLLDTAGKFLPANHKPKDTVLVKRFIGRYSLRQIVPGQSTFGDRMTVDNKLVSYSLDIVQGTGEYWPNVTAEVMFTEVTTVMRETTFRRIWTLLDNLVVSLTGPDHVEQYIDDVVTTESLDRAIAYVDRWTLGVRSIIGTIEAFGDLKGITSYKGVSVIQVDQVYDYSDQPVTKLYPSGVLVVGQEIGEYFTYDEPTKEFVMSEDRHTIDIKQMYGLMLHHERGMAKIRG